MQFHDDVHVEDLESSKKNKICEKTKREIESNKINSNLVSGKWLDGEGCKKVCSKWTLILEPITEYEMRSQNLLDLIVPRRETTLFLGGGDRKKVLYRSTSLEILE